MTNLEKNQWLENQERKLVEKICFEIASDLNPYEFYKLLQSALNNLAFLDIEYQDYLELGKKVNIIMQDEKLSNDKIFMEFDLIYQIFDEIATLAKPSRFLDSFYCELNHLTWIGVSEEKYEELTKEVKEEREFIDFMYNHLDYKTANDEPKEHQKQKIRQRTLVK